MTDTPLISATGLTISFGGIKALDGVDFSIGAGEIRCLAGENGSGKSTLVKILSGVYQPDAGHLTIGGERVHRMNPIEASAAGVQVIYQDLSLFGHLSVAENIAINRMLHNGSKLVSRSEIRRIAAEQLERVGINLDLDATVSSLSVANRQIVAICRALSMEARVLFMDEPTTALTAREVERLLAIVLELKAAGLSVVFISHKLDEVFKVSDSVTIFRDGNKVGDFAASELDELSLSRHMTGRDIVYTRYHRENAENSPLLEVRDLTRAGHYENFSLTVRPGDIVGLTGLLGSGRTEVALSLFGLNKPDSGTVVVRGTPVAIGAPWDAISKGIALLPEDRLEQGLFPTHSVASNISATMAERVSNAWRVLRPKKEKQLAEQVVHAMGVNNKNTDISVVNLSGGNQQKVVIGKWIFRDPTVFILDSPTVGIDIGSKSEIYDRMHELARAGMGIIMISDEPEEIVANCNRVVVMHDGEILAKFVEEDLANPEFQDELVEMISNPDYRFASIAPPVTGSFSTIDDVESE